MDWKSFFKPNLKKIILMIVLTLFLQSILALVALPYYQMLSDAEASVINAFSDQYDLGDVQGELMTPNTFLEVLFHNMFAFIRYPYPELIIKSVLGWLSSYVVSCGLIYQYNKLKK